VVESQPSKLLVAGSIPVSRSRLRRFAGVSEAAAGEIPSVRREGGSSFKLTYGIRTGNN
jgi:hypothetical protein